MRLIDADALKPKVEAMVMHKCNESDYEYGGNQAFDYVADILIDDAPTIDAVEVVRCKDCKHSFYDKDYESYNCRKHEYVECFDADDYCSWGERND